MKLLRLPSGSLSKSKEGEKPVKEKKKIRWKQWIPFYIMGLPGLIYIFINNFE